MSLGRSERAWIEDEGYKALVEYMHSCTVTITSENKDFEHGTGVSVKYSNKNYIFTAAHVLAQEPDNEKILLIGKSDAPLIHVDKDSLPRAAFAGTHGRPSFASPSNVNIEERILGDSSEDIAALKVKNIDESLPYTIFHNIYTQGATKITTGEIVHICGFPGELAQQVEHRETKQRGATVFFHNEQREIKQISAAPYKLNPKIYFVTDFTIDEGTCNPKGMSGCGIWSIPKFKKGKVWSSNESQLLGIQSSFFPESELLKAIKIERLLRLL